MQQRLGRILKVIAPFLPVALAYLFAATREIELPGIYMDAVNPDYLVARWLNPDAQHIPARVAPGNDLLGRYPLLVLPDWGLFMPTAFLARASMEMASDEDYELARRRLCEGKDVSVALLTGDRAERFRQWQDKLDWTAPQIRGYRQRDGKLIFELATFAADDAGGRCREIPCRRRPFASSHWFRWLPSGIIPTRFSIRSFQCPH